MDMSDDRALFDELSSLSRCPFSIVWEANRRGVCAVIPNRDGRIEGRISDGREDRPSETARPLNP